MDRIREEVESRGGKSTTLPDLADRIADDIYVRRRIHLAQSGSVSLRSVIAQSSGDGGGRCGRSLRRSCHKRRGDVRSGELMRAGPRGGHESAEFEESLIG